jgi:single-stranded-DNA-specific exonuclease
MLEKKWVVPERNESKIKSLQEELKIHPILCQLLVQRGIDTYQEAKDFFRPSLDHLHDPFLMDGMREAVDRITIALQKKEKILFYGDYDVDGTTAVSLITMFFKKFYTNIAFYIPDRYLEGYGVSYKGLDWAADNCFTLIISLDCGVTAIDQVTYAKAKGMDFIICDHHLPGDDLPDAIAVLDAKKKTCNYPYKELSGAGVGFKLCQALATEYDLPASYYLDYIDLLAASIASDIVPITGENRVLAFFGLKKINENPIPGFKAMLYQQKVDRKLNIMDLVFIIGPRINAPGRLAHANAAVEILTSETVEQATEMALTINEVNADRKEIDTSITIEAKAIVEAIPDLDKKRTIVLSSDQWHKGVIGIVASRIVEKHYRPTIILAENEDGILTGSARSIKGFSIYEGLKECADLLIKYGGHDFAAGLSLTKENLPAFCERFEAAAAKVLTLEMLTPEIEIDAELSLSDINQKFYNVLDQMAPFGPGNMRPVFTTKGLKDSGYSKKVKEDHIKLSARNEMGVVMNGIGFGLGEHYENVHSGNIFDICYVIEENVWNNQTSLQLNLKDIR